MISKININNISTANNSKNSKANKIKVFKTLRSSLIIIQIFKNITQKKQLSIIKYNDYLKKRMNISILEYKKYFQIEVELEVTPKEELNGYKNYFFNYLEVGNSYPFYHVFLTAKKLIEKEITLSLRIM